MKLKLFFILTIIFLTNYTNINSLNVSGVTILNNNTSINSSLNVSGTTKLLDYNLNAAYFNVNVSNQLTPVLEFKGVKLNNGL